MKFLLINIWLFLILWFVLWSIADIAIGIVIFIRMHKEGMLSKKRKRDIIDMCLKGEIVLVWDISIYVLLVILSYLMYRENWVIKVYFRSLGVW